MYIRIRLTWARKAVLNEKKAEWLIILSIVGP